MLSLARAIADLADARPHQEAEARRGVGVDLYADQLRRLRRRVRHADHQPAGVGDSGHRRAEEGAGGADRRRGQRHDRDSLDAALTAWASTTALIDGADAGKFMSLFKRVLEGWDREIG